jgi:hypothetical protein
LLSGPMDWPTEAVTVSERGIVTVSPPRNLVGAASFRWQAVANGDVVQGDGILSIVSQPDPVLLYSEAITINEDEPGAVRFTIEDVDDPLGVHTLINTTTDPNVTVTVDGLDLVVMPAANFSGMVAVKAIATAVDGRSSNETTVSVIVRAVVDPPVFVDFTVSQNEDTTADHRLQVITDGVVDVEFAVDRVDGAVGNITIAGTVLRYIPAPDFAGVERWAITAITGGARTTAIMTVEIGAVNDPPRLVAGQVVTCTEDTQCLVPMAVIDVDSPLSSMQYTSTDTRFAQSGGGVPTFRLDTNFNGNLLVLVSVTDGISPATDATVGIQVLPAADPLALTLSAPTFDEDNVGFVFATVADVDGVGYRLETNETFAGGATNSRFITSGVLVLQPSENAFGTFPVTVRAIPTTGATQSATAMVTIAPVNDPPSISFVDSDFLGQVDETTAVEVTVVDADGDLLTIEARATFEGSLLTPINTRPGAFSINLQPSDRASRRFSYHELTVVVTDAEGEQARASLPFGQVMAEDCSLLATTAGAALPEDKLNLGVRGCKTVGTLPYTPALGWIDEPGFDESLWYGDGPGWDDASKTGVGPGFAAQSSLWRWVRTDEANAATNLSLPRRREMTRHFASNVSRVDFEWDELNIDCGDQANIEPGQSRLSCRDNPEIGFGLSVSNRSEQMAIYVMASDFRSLGPATCDEHEVRGAFINGLYLDERGSEIECTTF